MSALLLSALATSSSGQGALYVDDVFSTYLYTGNGSTQTINNGIDLAGKGGLVWIKGRTVSGLHNLVSDTARGGKSTLVTNSTGSVGSVANVDLTYLSNGFTINGGGADSNSAAAGYVSWTFRRAQKFFDVVTYTGNGVATGRAITHSLGIAPGFIIIKRTDTPSNWVAWHKGGATSQSYLHLNSTAASPQIAAGAVTDSYNLFPSTQFVVYGDQFLSGGVVTDVNANGGSYVAYLFAHDPSADGIIQCGSFTTDSSGNATVNLGWANGSQFAMIKAASTTGDWEMYDTARTSAWSGNDARLRTNLSSAEDFVARISASGTSITFAGLTANSTYIYMAIRSPS